MLNLNVVFVVGDLDCMPFNRSDNRFFLLQDWFGLLRELSGLPGEKVGVRLRGPPVLDVEVLINDRGSGQCDEEARQANEEA